MPFLLFHWSFVPVLRHAVTIVLSDFWSIWLLFHIVQGINGDSVFRLACGCLTLSFPSSVGNSAGALFPLVASTNKIMQDGQRSLEDGQQVGRIMGRNRASEGRGVRTLANDLGGERFGK